MFNILERKRISIHYTVPLETADLLKILKLDGERQYDEKALYELLVALEGVMQVDYDGMFSAEIYFEIDHELDSALLWEEISTIVGDYLE